MASLQDQLLKAGLADKSKAKQARADKRKKQKLKNSPEYQSTLSQLGDTDKEIKNNVKQLKKISKTASKPKTKEELRQKLIDMGIEPDF